MNKIEYRNRTIDCLRGIAILVVLFLHFHIAYALDQSALNNIFSPGFIKAVASNGNYGVTIFFVISGFLITSTTLKRYGELANIDVMNFYISRFARIMPCLLLLLCIITLFNLFDVTIFKNKTADTSFILAIISVLTFWHNILMEKAGYFNYCLNILWSLSVEEIFYFIFPLLCLFLKNKRIIIAIWISFIIVAPFYRSQYTDNEMIALYGYLSCFDAIAIGCIAAIIANNIQIKSAIRRLGLYLAGLLMIIVYFHNGIMENVVFGISIMALAAAIFLICASHDKENTIKLTPNIFSSMIGWFGRNSYELYLFHIIVLALMKEAISPNDLNHITKLIWFLLFLCLSALLAGIISTYYSQPINDKLRKYYAKAIYQMGNIRYQSNF